MKVLDIDRLAEVLQKDFAPWQYLQHALGLNKPEAKQPQHC